MIKRHRNRSDGVLGNKKCLFVVVPSLSVEERAKTDNSSVWNSFVVPVGVLSLISYCKANLEKMDFKIVDLREFYYSASTDDDACVNTKNNLKKILVNYKPDYIGLSALFNSCASHIKYIEDTIKEITPQAITIIGGGYATTSYKKILRDHSVIDAAIIAEGEIAMSNVFACSCKDELESVYKNSPSVVTRKSLDEGIVPKQEFLSDLDSIPTIDFSYLEQDIYQKECIAIMTSRGCPFNCVFCAAHLMAGKKVRSYSVERVIYDLNYFFNKGYRKFQIFDENFLLNKDRAKRILRYICELNDKKSVSVEFPSGVMIRQIDEEFVSLFAELGVKEINLALESGSERVLKEIIDKPVRKKDFELAVGLLKKYKIRQRVFIVAGLPGESSQDREETVNYLNDVGISWASVNLALPLYGSRLYAICKEKNYLVPKKNAETDLSIQMPDCSAEDLKEQVYRMNLSINFLNNYDMRMENFEDVIPIFEYLTTAYVDHAFAYYCLYICYKKIGNWDLSQKNLEKFQKIINEDIIWRNRAEALGIL